MLWVSHLSCWMVSSCLPLFLRSSASTPGEDSRRSTSFLVVETRGLSKQLFPLHESFPILKPCSVGMGGMHYSMPFCLLCFLMDFQLCRCFKNPFACSMRNHCCISYCTYLLCLKQHLWISKIHNSKIICIKNIWTWKQWCFLATVRMFYSCNLQFGKICPEFWRLNVKLAKFCFCSLYPTALNASWLFLSYQLNTAYIYFIIYQTCMAILTKVF